MKSNYEKTIRKIGIIHLLKRLFFSHYIILGTLVEDHFTM